MRSFGFLFLLLIVVALSGCGSGSSNCPSCNGGEKLIVEPALIERAMPGSKISFGVRGGTAPYHWEISSAHGGTILKDGQPQVDIRVGERGGEYEVHVSSGDGQNGVAKFWLWADWLDVDVAKILPPPGTVNYGTVITIPVTGFNTHNNIFGINAALSENGINFPEGSSMWGFNAGVGPVRGEVKFRLDSDSKVKRTTCIILHIVGHCGGGCIDYSRKIGNVVYRFE